MAPSLPNRQLARGPLFRRKPPKKTGITGARDEAFIREPAPALLSQTMLILLPFSRSPKPAASAPMENGSNPYMPLVAASDLANISRAFLVNETAEFWPNKTAAAPQPDAHASE